MKTCIKLINHRYNLLMIFLLCLVSCTQDESKEIVRAEILFNQGWLFHQGQLADINELNNNKVTWQSVDLPHDWAISGPFDKDVAGEQGKLPWQGEGWYKKTFNLNAQSIKGKKILFLFDGVMANPVVYVNGEKAGSWHYGYNSFWLDATDFITTHSNTIAVHASTLSHYSRWYPGAGIYRKVRMVIVDDVHVPIWGVKVETPKVTTEMATTLVKTDINNQSTTPKIITLHSYITKKDSKEILSSEKQNIILAAAETIKVEQSLTIKSPHLWDIDSPNLYQVHTELMNDESRLDYQTNTFGLRNFKWTHNDGFYLNGKRVQIKGVNLHHDNGPLGAALFKDSLVRKLKILKDMGVNSIRTSHNAPSPELLNLADEMGFIIYNELFDKYGKTASVDVPTAEYVEHYAEAEIRNFVMRDQNHPSVMLWSVGNEVGDVLRDKEHGSAIVEKLVGYFKKYDTTRPTSMGSHITSAIPNGILDSLDTQGWNYGQKYALTRELYPTIPQLYTESASAFSTRGFYQFEHPKHKNDYNPDFQETSYDLTAATWADIADVEFMRMQRDTYVAGEYVWTGFDYLGEPTPHNKDARSSYFGIVDLVGLPKDRYYFYRSHWNNKEDTIHILPHWTWPDRIDKKVPVYVYTNGDEAELFLNGKSLGKRYKKTEKAGNKQQSNLAFSALTKASSEDISQNKNGKVVWENRADKAVDGDDFSKWTVAEDSTFPHWLMIDLKRDEEIGYVSIDWDYPSEKVKYQLQTSTDSKNWTTLATNKDQNNLANKSILKVNGLGRYIRVLVTGAYDDWYQTTIGEIVVKRDSNAKEDQSNPYYKITDRYRLRWEDVIYQPGELTVKVSKKGKFIGEKTVSTASKAVELRLTPEQKTITTDGHSLAYFLIEMLDDVGNLVPQDMSKVKFEVSGPADIVGIGNGNPISLEPFQDNEHSLFYGKAVLILRSHYEGVEDINITATGDNVKSASAIIKVTLTQ